MWLNGSRFRKRIGLKGIVYLRYFAISRSIGTMLARMFLCVRTTPLGSAVAPDVKMISAVVLLSRSEVGLWRMEVGSWGSGRLAALRKTSLSFQTLQWPDSAAASTVSP